MTSDVCCGFRVIYPVAFAFQDSVCGVEQEASGPPNLEFRGPYLL